MSNFQDVKTMHRKFGIACDSPRKLTKEEYIFRIGAMYEELMEYLSTVFDVGNSPDELREIFVDHLKDLKLREDAGTAKSLAAQFDALLDLGVFTMGTAERQGFPWDQGWPRVNKANISKELAEDSGKSKRDFSIDLVKPEGWKAPVLEDLTVPLSGVVVLEGPDGYGKTTFAEMLRDKYDATILHHTWSPELEAQMYDYHMNTIHTAKKIVDAGGLVVIDRSWISEFIYSDVFRSGTNWPMLSVDAYKALDELHATYVFCVPFTKDSEDIYFARFEELKSERSEMHKDMTKCLAAFKEFTFGNSIMQDVDERWYTFNEERRPEFLGSMYPEDEGAIHNIPRSCMLDYNYDPDYELVMDNLKRYLTVGEL